MSNTSTETYESISGAVQLVASQAGKYFGGAVGQAYATFLTGQNSWVASVSDLAAKVQNGTATGEDFADVASKTASILGVWSTDGNCCAMDTPSNRCRRGSIVGVEKQRIHHGLWRKSFRWNRKNQGSHN